MLAVFVSGARTPCGARAAEIELCGQMESDAYKPPAAPPDSDPWVKLTWYRGLILSFFPLLILRSFVTNETARTGLFFVAAALLAFGIVQAAGYICPICDGRFTLLKKKTALLGALPALVVVAYGVLMRASCKSCGARVGDTSASR